MKKIIRSFTAVLTAICALTFAAVIQYNISLPNDFYVKQADSFYFRSGIVSSDSHTLVTQTSSNGAIMQNQLKLFNIIPIKQISVSEVAEIKLIPSGSAFGVKMFTDGPIVVETAIIQTKNGHYSPADEAGISSGDIVTHINDVKMTGNEDIVKALQENTGEMMKFTLERDGEIINTTLTPALSVVDNKYKSGLWVRDSAAGIGTLTYINPEDDTFGGLGHPICDVDTGLIMSVSSGEICKVEISSVTKGVSGNPGELSGVFSQEAALGNIAINDQTGLYGKLSYDASDENAIPVAYKQDIVTGPATIRSNLHTDKVTEFDIIIEEVDYSEENIIKNMVIRITDPELIEKTGGIVQGMSGSPIVQNGKLIGAVTHVFVNDPTRGYGIFIENMLESAESIDN